MKRLIFAALFLVYANADVLTLRECVEKTISSHPDIKSFVLKDMLSKEELKSQKAFKYPQVEVHAQYDPVKTFTFSRNGRFDSKNDSFWEAGVSVREKLWDFKKTDSKIKAAKISKEISKLSLKDIENLISYKVKSLYLQLIFYKKAIEVRKKDVEAKKAFYERAKALEKRGLKTKADSYRFLAALYKAKDILNSTKNSFLKTKRSLELYMGEKIPDNVDLEENLLLEDEKLSFEDVKNRLLKENLSLKEAQKEIDKSIYLYKSAKAEKYGSLDLSASYSRIDALFEYDSYFAGVFYSVPIFTGGRLNAIKQKAKISQMISKERLESKKRELLDELQSLFLDIDSLNSTIKARLMEAEALKKSAKIVNARYKEGLSTYMEVLDAEALLADSALSVLQARFERKVKEYRIKYLIGMSDEKMD